MKELTGERDGGSEPRVLGGRRSLVTLVGLFNAWRIVNSGLLEMHPERLHCACPRSIGSRANNFLPGEAHVIRYSKIQTRGSPAVLPFVYFLA